MGKVRFQVSLQTETVEQLLDFWKEIEILMAADPNEISNTLLIFPEAFPDFEDYLDFFSLAEQLLATQGKESSFQLAGFHPYYRFSHTEASDPGNYTNRAPFPILHILRVDEVAAAIDSHPDINAVPEDNERKLREMGEEKIQDMLREIRQIKE